MHKKNPDEPNSKILDKDRIWPGQDQDERHKLSGVSVGSDLVFI